MSQTDARAGDVKGLVERNAAPLPAGEAAGEPITATDVRWAVNYLLETIAKKFEANDTWDIWRSDAAELVRSHKHADVPLHTERDRAIEECARIAEERFKSGEWSGHYYNAGTGIAAAIRALASPTPVREGE